MTAETTPAIAMIEDTTGKWKIELRNFPEIEKALGREVLNAFCRCFVHSERLTSTISCIHASAQCHGRESTAHSRDHLSMVWFTIGTLHELADAIQAARKALRERGRLESKSTHWATLRDLRRRWKKEPLFRTVRNKAAFHVDAEVIDEGLKEFVKHHAVELGRGHGDKTIDSTLSLGDLALLKGLGLSRDDQFREFISKVRDDHLAVANAVHSAFYDAVNAAEASHD